MYMYVYLFIDLHHGAGQGVYPGSVAPHWVGGEGVVQHRVQVCPIHSLQLVMVWVASEGHGTTQ